MRLNEISKKRKNAIRPIISTIIWITMYWHLPNWLKKKVFLFWKYTYFSMNLKFEHLLSQSSLRMEVVALLTMQAMYLIRTIQWCYVIRIIFPRNIFNFQSKDKNSNLGHWIVLKSQYNLNQLTMSGTEILRCNKLWVRYILQY